MRILNVCLAFILAALPCSAEELPNRRNHNGTDAAVQRLEAAQCAPRKIASDGRVERVTYSPDGKKLLVYSLLAKTNEPTRYRLTVMDLETHKSIWSQDDTIHLTNEVFSPDGNSVLYVERGRPKVSPLTNPSKPKAIPVAGNSMVAVLTTMPDGRILIGDDHHLFYVFDPKTDKTKFLFEHPGDAPGRIPFSDVVFSKDGRYVVTFSGRSTHVFDLEKNESSNLLSSDIQSALNLFPEGTNNIFRAYSEPDKQIIRDFTNAHKITKSALSSDGKQIILGGDFTYLLSLANLPGGERKATAVSARGGAMKVGYLDGGKRLFVATWDEFYVFDRTGELQRVIPFEGEYANASVSPDFREVALLNRSGEIRLVSLDQSCPHSTGIALTPKERAKNELAARVASAEISDPKTLAESRNELVELLGRPDLRKDNEVALTHARDAIDYYSRIHDFNLQKQKKWKEAADSLSSDKSPRFQYASSRLNELTFELFDYASRVTTWAKQRVNREPDRKKRVDLPKKTRILANLASLRKEEETEAFFKDESDEAFRHLRFRFDTFLANDVASKPQLLDEIHRVYFGK